MNEKFLKLILRGMNDIFGFIDFLENPVDVNKEICAENTLDNHYRWPSLRSSPSGHCEGRYYAKHGNCRASILIKRTTHRRSQEQLY